MPSSPSDEPELKSLALLGSFVPRQCGIATFTKDLRDAIAGVPGAGHTLVLAMDDVPESYAYPEEVQFQIRAFQRSDYVNAADMLNINQVDLTVVQHEYGIYGGPDGRYVLDFMNHLRTPVITTLHTVLADPSPGQATVTLELARLSDRLVVMSDKAVEMLQRVYEIAPEKIAMIPHGIPEVPFVDPAFYKDQFGLEGRRVLLTFGLLSPGKGIEYAIRALPAIVAAHPDVVYVILGATHPNILKQEGNAYRHSLERLADKLGVGENVVFHNRFVTLQELCGFIGAADIYLTPYLNAAQITSGTLAYALGAGKAVISTPFWYAEEMLAGGRGSLFPFKDSERLTETVNALLDDGVRRNAMRKSAYLATRAMVWREVGNSYLQLAHQVLQERQDQPRPSFSFPAKPADIESVPEVKLSHLRTLTDETGILQHATYCIPDRNHGYCTDDNARALAATLMYHEQYRDDTVLPLVPIYLGYLAHGFHPETGRFRNFMSFDRQWLEEIGSEDSHGRALWALGLATALGPNEALVSFATRLFNDALEGVNALKSPRAWAHVLVGIHAYLRRFDGDTRARRARRTLGRRLYKLFENHATDEWPWCEDTVTYCNARLPHALLLSGQWIPDARMVKQGLRSLEWLVDLQTLEDGTVSLIGNRGWLERSGNRACFDQQPVEAMALVEACAEAYRCTQDPVWRQRARNFIRWFLGNNETQSAVYDFATGGCRDGLHPDGPNLNEGAESTLAWLIAVLTMNELSRHESASRTAPTVPSQAAAGTARRRDAK